MIIRNFFAAILFFYAAAATAFPIATEPRPAAPPVGVFAQYDFEGIVALSGCSGSLVKFIGQPETDKAYVMTNGHCHETGYIPIGEIIYGRASSRQFTLLTPDGRDAGRIRASHTVYATMTKTDAALYRTSSTYAEIKRQFNIRPLEMSADHPAAKIPIEIISGYWRRGYRCDIDGFVFKLMEAGYENNDSIRFTRACNTIGGTSGSPILAAGTRTQIGINNTGNEHGGRCTEGNPCEVDEQGNVTYSKGINYGQQTYWFYSCLNSRYEIDLNIPGCELPH